jgi:hypothetical protein
VNLVIQLEDVGIVSQNDFVYEQLKGSFFQKIAFTLEKLCASFRHVLKVTEQFIKGMLSNLGVFLRSLYQPGFQSPIVIENAK